MPLKNRRQQYSWAPSNLTDVELMTDKKTYSRNEPVLVNLGFRVVGGLRESFHPDVWTVAWEDYDKIVRLTIGATVGVQRGIRFKQLAQIKKEVRKASFYWSRDPDLPYRIWVMIMPEDGGPPQIPLNVEDAKSRMLDVAKSFEIPADELGKGRHWLAGSASVRWGRRSFIEKGELSAKSKPVAVEVE
ncbi:MAG: hypothetical protein LYZ69_04790 [Nitrososphaerales archaeon]|nr:hypothetical protein [Nitrososphaerales archaeon]